MKLHLLRHGIAAEPGTASISRDADRPLTREGIARMRDIAGAMEAMDLGIEQVLTSPLRRARETAEIVAARLKLKQHLEVTPTLAIGGDLRELVRRLNTRKPAPGSVLLVGHEPDLSRLMSLLVSGDTGFLVTLKKGGLARVTADPLIYGRCATLDWLLAPKQMLLMAGA